MDSLTMVLSVLSMLILAVSLIYTFRVGKLVSDRHSKFDTQIDEKVQDHPYMRNPIFLAFIIAGLLSFGYILYVAFTTSW